MDTKIEYNAQIGQNHQSDSSKLVNNRKRTLPPNTYSSIQTDAIKRPCLTVDTTTEPLCEALSSSESFNSTVNENVNYNSDTTATTGLSTTATTGLNDTATTGLSTTATTGLSAYLEDIDSDEELDEIVTTPPTNDKPRGKDELLSLMDQVDQDITTTEQRLMSLENKQRELIETLKQPSSTEEIPHVTMATSDESGSGQHKSLIELIYTDNRIKAIGTTEYPITTPPLYYQPTEAPKYWYNIQSHQQFRPDLLKYLKTRKLAQYKKEYSLCVVYDQLLQDWDKKIDKWENSQKKRVRDIRNRDIFEKTFPELRSKSEQLRDQAERLASNRSGVRSFGFVKSEAELNEIAYELFEQEEAKGRHSLTHANIPSMILNDKERQLQFINTNGLLRDPMILYRESKGTLLWNDHEKTTFREKFQLYPKNFEKISSYLHNKSVSDCVRYYYLAKKNSNFKSLSRRYKRRRHQIPKAHEYSLLIDQSKPHPHPDTTSLQSHKEVSWTDDEISRLKNGLRIYGRVWGRVYKEVGGVKTATQCKQFYDDYCLDETLDLNNALAEHTERKNAERVEKKMAEMKKIPVIQSDNNNNNTEEESESDTSDPLTSQEEEGECSDSETTITDSGQEEDEREVTVKPKLNPLQLSNNDNTMKEESLQSPLDIFLSAAEALSNTVPSEIALHDHTYSCPPLDIHGGSGLQLIAAAAAVVSPSLSRTTWINSSNKTTPLSNTVKAPRGRPPSTQKRNTANPQKISPSFLTPTSGVSQNVLLHDIKPTLRGRSRSAPTDKPRTSLPQKNPLQSPLLLKGGTKLFTTVQQSFKGGQSPLSYSRTKEGTLVSLKSSTDTEAHKLTTPSIIQSKNMQNRTRDSNPVLELSIGNMALLLAAGNNQQATLLLPQSSLFNNKHTLLLCSSNRSDTTDTPTITKQTPTLSIKATTNIPTITPLPNKPSFTLSLASGQVRQTPVTLPRSKIYSSAPVTPVTTPTIDDLSNLNLLSNLVVGLTSTKSQSCPKPSTITTNMNPTNITTTTNNRWKKKQSIDPLTRTVSSATQQSAVMLYSRSLPLNTDTPPEEEDHLEYATRGIDELTRLLGGTTNTTNNNTTNNGLDQEKHHQSLVSWSPDELLCNPFTKDDGTNTTITVNSTTVNTTGYVTNHTTNNNNTLLTHSTN